MRRFKSKTIAFLVVFSMVLSMGVSFGATGSYTSEKPATLTGVSTNKQSVAVKAWYDSSDNLYIAVASNFTMEDTITLKKSGSPDIVGSSLGEYDELVLDGQSYDPVEFTQGNSKDARWKVYRFNSSDLKDGIYELFVYAESVGGGHDITGTQKVTVIDPDPEPDYWTVEFKAGANGSLTGTALFENIEDGTDWDEALTVPTPVADEGYEFDKWSAVFPETVDEDLVFTASFKLKQTDPDPDPDYWTVEFKAGANGSLTGTALFENIEDGTAWNTAVTVPTPVADEGYEFDKWSAVFPETVDEDLVFTASFKLKQTDPGPDPDPDPTWKVEFKAGANGSLSGQTEFVEIEDGTDWNTAVTVPTPVADEGYEFDKWSAVFPETVDEDLVFTASFKLKQTDPGPDPDPDFWTVTFLPGSNGSLSGQTEFEEIEDGSPWSVIDVPTVNARSGYRFDGWSASFPDEITQDLVFTAQYRTVSTGGGGGTRPPADDPEEPEEEVEEITIEEELPQAPPEPEVPEIVEEPVDLPEEIEVELEQTPQAFPTLPATGAASSAFGGLGALIMALGFAIRKKF